MSKTYQQLIDGNKAWRKRKAGQPNAFFDDMAAGQAPQTLFIGCADSRVHANEITDAEAGSIFVHRNVANLVVQSDMNFLGVLNYAVAALQVKNIVVCGHHGCGGVTAAMTNQDAGIVNHWIQPVKDVQKKYQSQLDGIDDQQEKVNRLVEFNAIEQVHNISKIRFIQDAWQQHNFSIYGWAFSLRDGKVHELDCTISGMDDVRPTNKWS